jgi:hypothetical protein
MAFSLGASRWRIFRTVTLPLAVPGFANAFLLLFAASLADFATPLIRYELTDQVVLLDEPCPCGSSHRRVADVQGRLDDRLVYGNVDVHPHVLRSEFCALAHTAPHEAQVLVLRLAQAPPASVRSRRRAFVRRRPALP